jgi:hypothetical protein
MSMAEINRPAQPHRFGGLALGASLMALALFVGLLPAQSTLSTIRGTVTDPSAALVPGVEITLTDTATNTTRTVVSGDTGNFELPNLKPGTYKLQAQLSGFKMFVAENIILTSSETRRIDVRLEIGQTTAEVTVNAAAAVIEKE